MLTALNEFQTELDVGLKQTHGQMVKNFGSRL